MTYILHIESSTKNCSVSISENGKNVALIEERYDQYMHSEKLLVFIDEVIKKTNISRNELSSVAVSKGPGSYTGLRIGVSLAKGLCYALDIPLISVPSTQVLAHTLLLRQDISESDIICSTIDARRMEVYNCFYDNSIQPISNIISTNVDENFASEYADFKVYFIGDSVQKIADTITHQNFDSIEMYPSAQGLEKVAFEKFQKKEFEDVAYFEPYYLKEFMAG